MDTSTASTNGAQDGAPRADSASNPRHDSRLPSAANASSNRVSRHSSASNSATSRDASPSRKPRRTTFTGSASPSPRNSQHDLSPVRQPKPACADPAPSQLSSTAAPTLRPAAEHPVASPTPQKPAAVQDLKEGHRWPLSPRLLSPSPPLSKLGVTSARRGDPHDHPVINVQRASPSPQRRDSQQTSPETDSDDPQMPSGIKTPVRGALETVQEVSQNNSPAHAADAALLEHVKQKLAAPNNHSDSALVDGGPTFKPQTHGSSATPAPQDTTTSRSESRRPSSVPPPPALVTRHSSAMSTKQIKSKPEGSTQNMTVETETVPSVPQVVLAATKAEAANGSLKSGTLKTGSLKPGSLKPGSLKAGTLKTKPSAETIRPKKDKKKSTRKQPAVGSGTGSSKADIFEAKVANAVDEANTSDSEETFVYDSNPPDNTERSTRRFHSRTPSATSMVSQADRPNLRSIYGVMEGGGHGHGHGHGPVPKKSMKFVNTFGGNGSDTLTPADEDGKGTGRSAGGSTRGTLRHHHHIGRWGRQPGNGHASLFDNESPFPNAAKSKLAGSASRTSSGPPSPRNYHSARGQFGTKRSAMQMSSSYDLDDTTGADDERTPLVEAGRSLRASRSRRGPHSLRQAESQNYTRRSSYLNRFAACLVLTMMFLLVITGAIGFMFATSQPMTGIEIVSIGNVVTSEQVLMYDVTVKAHNPNIVVVTIDRANLEIFAKSEYADGDPKRRKHHHDGSSSRLHARDDPANDPPLGPGDGDNDSRPNILLGRVAMFDSSLTFEGSLFHQGTSSSTGQMQLQNPGNNTADGSERWNNIYQHEFDLIVKGVVKYSLPLSAHVRSATVSGRTTVKPNSANKPSPKPNVTESALS